MLASPETRARRERRGTSTARHRPVRVVEHFARERYEGGLALLQDRFSLVGANDPPHRHAHDAGLAADRPRLCHPRWELLRFGAVVAFFTDFFRELSANSRKRCRFSFAPGTNHLPRPATLGETH